LTYFEISTKFQKNRIAGLKQFVMAVDMIALEKAENDKDFESPPKNFFLSFLGF
jgi:hypothetical protein